MKDYSWESERLFFRLLKQEDLPAYYDIVKLDEVGRWLASGRGKTKEEALAKILLFHESFSSKGYGVWGVWEKKSEILIGQAGLMEFYQGVPEVKYAFSPQFWGQGYATESAVACLSYGFTKMNLRKIMAIANPDNSASHRVLTKAGLIAKGSIDFKGKEMSYFEMTVEQWKQRDIRLMLKE